MRKSFRLGGSQRRGPLGRAEATGGDSVMCSSAAPVSAGMLRRKCFQYIRSDLERVLRP